MAPATGAVAKKPKKRKSQSRTTKPTQALSTFGVYGPPSEDEIAVLDLADSYRLELSELYWSEHKAALDLRERQFPHVFASMVRVENIKARIYRLEKEIKEHHSEVRNRNAVRRAQRATLRQLREELKIAKAEASANNAEWLQFRKDAKAMLGGEDTKKERQKMSDFAEREEFYASIQWPDHMREYGEMMLDFDMRRRRLWAKYQDLGLLSSIRNEIVAATKPKQGKTGPGMKYLYTKEPPVPQQWGNITQQFTDNGLPVLRAMREDAKTLKLEPVYTILHNRRSDETIYKVTMQIGTRELPRKIVYFVKFHKPIPPSATIQRWTLKVDKKGRRSCIPIMSDMNFKRPTGEGVFAYDLTWTVVPGGIRVCKFVGTNVNEEIVLPQWLVDQRMGAREAQRAADNTANDLLEARGTSRSKKSGSRHGVEALEEYCGDHPDDEAAKNVLDQLRASTERAYRKASRALRAIEKVYETAVKRVCMRHEKVMHDKLDVAEIKKYAKRDLLKEDPLPEKSRDILHAVAPGKVRALIKRYRLKSVGDKQKREKLLASTKTPRTDLFTGFIKSLGVKTGTKPNAPHRRVQGGPPENDKRD